MASSREPRIAGVSAVVCNFNGAAYLGACLESLFLQPGLDEVLVVDNASADGSVALVRERFPRARVLELPTNRGPCAARNAGMRAARHRWVLAVDNDAVLAPDLLPKLRAALEARPDAMLAQPRSVRDDAPDVVHYDGGAFHYVGLLALRNFWAPLATAEGEGVLETDALVAIAALLDKQRVLAVGGYDETFFYLAEDFDLALRLRQAGERLLLVEDAIARHKGGTRGLSFRGGSYPKSRARLFARNRWLLIAKDYALRTIVVALPGILVYEAVWLLFVTLQGHLGAHLSGKLDFFRGLSGTLRARRDVQARRRVPDRALLVGKPLSLSPSLVASGAARAAARALELVLAGWWGIARWLAG